MEIPQAWMPPDMPDEQKDEIAAKHPDDPFLAAAEAWATWANEMPVDTQGVSSISTGNQSITYEAGGPYEAAMDRYRWYKSRSGKNSAVQLSGDYKFGWNRPTRWTGWSDAAEGDPPLANGEPWGAITVTTADVVLTNGTGPLARSNFQTQEDANNELVQQIASKADQDHVHADDGSAVDLTDYETKADAAAAHNALDQNINTGLAGKADNDHVHDTDLSGYVTKDEADAAHQELDQKIDAAAAGDHAHGDYETKAEAKAAHDSLSGRITQVGQDKADTGHGHLDYETKLQAQDSHQDLQDQITDRALVSHNHPELAPDLSDYETKVASETRDAGLENQIKGKADLGHTHPEVQPPDLTNYVTKPDLAADQARQDQALTEGLAEKSETSHLHDGSDGGAHYELEADAVQRYERTALELSTKADKDHDHPSGDHAHDDLATSVELQTETALRKQGDADLQSQINSAVAGGHSHTEYADKSHSHGGYSATDHKHPEYEGGGGGGDVTKAYVDSQDAAEKQAREAGDDALQAQIDSIQHTPPYDDQQIKDDLAQETADREAGDDALQAQIDAVGVKPPAEVSQTPPGNPSEGDLWFMSDVFLAEGEIPVELSADKLFVYADGKWEPATSLQHERRFREIGDLQAVADAAYYTQREDGKHVTRMDKALLPEPVFVDKDVTVHDDGVIPPVQDDNLHFSDPISKKWSTISYKGEDPGPDIYYAIMSHKSNYPSPRREEWIVREVKYENGIVTLTADDPYGCVGGHSHVYPCTLWLLTEEDATKIPGLDLTQQDGEVTGLENLTPIGTLRYDRGNFTWGADAKNNYARFNHGTPTLVGLNQYPLEGGTILWREVFPVGDTLIIEGAAGSMALRVLETQISGTNNRTHNFKTEVLYRTGEFEGEEVLTISTGNVATQKQLLLDGVVVGDSTYEPRITALESAPDPDLEHDHDDEYAKRSEVEQLALGLQSISTPRCNGLWQFKGKLSDGPPRNNGEFSLVYDHDRQDNYITFVTTDLNGERIDLMSLVQAGDYVQVYDVQNPDSYTLHTIDEVILGSMNPEMVEMPCTLVAHGNELVKFDQCAIRFFAVTVLEELTARMDAFEELMKPWSGIDIGTYATKSSGNYEPTGTTQDEGTAAMWWTNVSMNTTPNNHVRIGMADKDLCKQIAATPVPFEMDVIQPGAKQTWHVYEVYERGEGVLHVLNDVAWGDPLTHSHIAVDTQYIVRKV